MGRKIYVVPSLDLVVTRLGDEPPKASRPEGSDFNEELWRRLMAAAPQGQRSGSSSTTSSISPVHGNGVS
jgi:hypothetical protein